MTLAADTGFHGRLIGMIKTITHDRHFQKDMFQEAIYHVILEEPKHADETESWWLDSCKWHVFDELIRKGRSVDALKRRNLAFALDEVADLDNFTPEAVTSADYVYSAVSAADILRQLTLRLDSLEANVLMALAEGHGVGETAARFGISRRTIVNYRKVFTAAAYQIGLAE